MFSNFANSNLINKEKSVLTLAVSDKYENYRANIVLRYLLKDENKLFESIKKGLNYKLNLVCKY